MFFADTRAWPAPTEAHKKHLLSARCNPATMVLKKSRSPAKAPKSPKNQAPAAPPPEPPAGLGDAISALDQLANLPVSASHIAPSHQLPLEARTCLDAMSAREQQPRRLATLAVEGPDGLVDNHAKLMATKCTRCAELLRSKYRSLEQNKLGMALATSVMSTPKAARQPGRKRKRSGGCAMRCEHNKQCVTFRFSLIHSFIHGHVGAGAAVDAPEVEALLLRASPSTRKRRRKRRHVPCVSSPLPFSAEKPRERHSLLKMFL